MKQAPCPHCKQSTQSGKHNGCMNCGRVKHQANGRINGFVLVVKKR